jgi:hypothetical protein
MLLGGAVGMKADNEGIILSGVRFDIEGGL